MLELAKLRAGETLVDLGCGDGRLLLRAVSPPFNAGSAVGFELDDDLVAAARRAAGSCGRVRILQQDLRTSDEFLRKADVVSLYLTQKGNASLLPLLQASLRPGARVVSYVWGMGDELPPSRTANAVGTGVVLTTPRPNILLWEQEALVHHSPASPHR